MSAILRKLGVWLLLGSCLWVPPGLAEELPAPTPAAPLRKVVYLTFDDGPGEKTMALLDALAEAQVPATFFLVGKYIERYPAETRAIRDGGHVIASHSYGHGSVRISTQEGFLKDERKFQAALDGALGEPTEVRLIRFPYGSGWASPKFLRWIEQDRGYTWLDWNASNYDADAEVGQDYQKMFSMAIKSAGSKPEVVMLMHEGKSRTIRMLPELVQHFRDNGYEFDVIPPDFHLIPGVSMGLGAKPDSLTAQTPPDAAAL